MAKAFKCDKCEGYFDKEVGNFNSVDKFTIDHIQSNVTVSIGAIKSNGDYLELCGACWVELLTKVQADIKNPIPF